MYAYLGSKSNKKVDITLNGKEIIEIEDQNNYCYNILELGNYKDETITLEIELLEDTIKLENYMFYTLDLTKFENSINILKQNEELKIIDYNKNYIKATINVEDENKILYTSLPYDDNLIIKVDNKKIEKEKIFDTLLGIKLEKGKHEILIEYKSKGLKEGMILSIVGLILFLIKRKIDK